jgi:hypothetical protein
MCVQRIGTVKFLKSRGSMRQSKLMDLVYNITERVCYYGIYLLHNCTVELLTQTQRWVRFGNGLRLRPSGFMTVDQYYTDTPP